MAVRIGGTAPGEKRTRIDFGDAGDLNIVWRPGMFTAAQLDQLVDAAQWSVNYQVLATALVSWDLLDDNGEPIPTDAESIERLVPTHLVQTLLREMSSDGAGEVIGAT